MSLSKQLYFIISLIFFMIFTGNFIISVKNTKEYLISESLTKAQDTATSLGMSLKNLIKDKTDPEIKSIINAIADSGFYKEIRLEDVETNYNKDEIATKLLEDSNQIEIVKMIVLDNNGEIIENSDSDDLSKQLALLENTLNVENSSNENKKYIFIPNENFKNSEISVKVDYIINNKNYTKTILLNTNKILAKATRAEKFEYVPLWFINLIPMELEEKNSEISDGWKTSAIIFVSANAGEAYAKLFEQAKSAIIYALISFVIAIILLAIFLRFILQPLKRIELVAKNIAKGKFETIDDLPWTTEIRNVAISINDMSTKIEGVITKLNQNLENMTKKISLDGLTGLSLKQTFETDMKQMFISKSKGYILTIKIDELATFAKEYGNKAVDKFLIDFANILKNSNEKFSGEVKAYRFFGSEFAVIAKNIPQEELKELTIFLKEEFEKLSSQIHKSSIAHIGATPFNPIGTTPEILSASFEAYQKAKQIGPNEAFIRDESDLARDMEIWRDLIFKIIDNSEFEVGYINDAYSLDGTNTLLMEEAFTNAKDKQNNIIPIGTFVSIAEQYEKVVDFDKAVILKVINHILKNNISHQISINLSLDSIANFEFKLWLKQTIAKYPQIASKLVFSITAYGVAQNVNNFKEFVELVHSCNSKIIIKRFESKFIPLNNIKDFNLDFIRLARDYTNDISKDVGKKAFVESMQDLAKLLNIKVFAENVKDDSDLEIVKELNLYGASR